MSMLETFTELSENLSEIKQKFETIDLLKNGLVEKENEMIKKIVELVQPILKFIDTKIVSHDDEFYDGNDHQGKIRYFSEKGIILTENHDDLATGRFEYERDGYVVILFRSGKIQNYKISGYWSRWQNSSRLYELISDDVAETNFTIDNVIHSIIKSYKKAILENEADKVSFKTRIDKLKDIEKILEN